MFLGPEIFFNDLGDPNLDDGSSFGKFLNSEEEEEWKGRWWISTLESHLTFEAFREEDGLTEDSNDDLDRFSNKVLVDSNLDEIRCMELESWKEYFEVRLVSSVISSIEVSDKEERVI